MQITVELWGNISTVMRDSLTLKAFKLLLEDLQIRHKLTLQKHLQKSLLTTSLLYICFYLNPGFSSHLLAYLSRVNFYS